MNKSSGKSQGDQTDSRREGGGGRTERQSFDATKILQVKLKQERVGSLKSI